MASRGRHVLGELDRGALRGLGPDGPGLGPRGRAALRPPSPGRRAFRGRGDIRQGPCAWSTPRRPETDQEMKERARICSVRELAQLGRSAQGAPAISGQTDYEMRSVRFNDTFRTVTAQLPPESYAEVRASLEARARRLPSDGETRWDQRLCDGFLALVRGGGAARKGSYAVVAHVPLASLLDEASELAGELERGELISGETVRRIACDATIVVAVDDDVGHTMYEGRARRDPDRGTTPGDHATGPALPLPRLYQRDVHQRAPHQAVETRRSHGPAQSRVALRPPPSPRAQPGMDHVGQCGRGADVRWSDRPGHDVATLAALVGAALSVVRHPATGR